MSDNTDEVVAQLEAAGKGKSAAARGKAPKAVQTPVPSNAGQIDTLPSGIKRTNW